MILLVLSMENLKRLRQALSNCLGGFRNGHLYEGLARALGFTTHASARRHLQALTMPEVREFNLDVLKSRLQELGHGRALVQIEPTLFARLDLPIYAATLEGGKVRWTEEDAVLLRLDVPDTPTSASPPGI